MENDMPAADAFESAMTMSVSDNLDSPLVFALIASLCALFLAITFIQSGLNKLTDYSGNKSYFNSVFEKTPLKSTTGLLLPVIMLMELGAGFGCLAGIPMLWFNWHGEVLGYSLVLAGLTFICLLFGQRVAKDYAGAASLTGYFIVAVIGIFGFAFAI